MGIAPPLEPTESKTLMAADMRGKIAKQMQTLGTSFPSIWEVRAMDTLQDKTTLTQDQQTAVDNFAQQFPFLEGISEVVWRADNTESGDFFGVKQDGSCVIIYPPEERTQAPYRLLPAPDPDVIQHGHAFLKKPEELEELKHTWTDVETTIALISGESSE